MQARPHRFIGMLAAFCASSLMSTALAQGAAPPPGDVDYSQLPPDPKTLEVELATFKMDAGAAMKAAAEATGGKVMTMRILKNKDKVDYELICMQNGLPSRVLIDAKSGELRVAKLEALAAVEKALVAVPGKVGNVEGDLMGDPPTWKVSVFAGGKSHLVSVNAIDGSIVSDQVASQLPGEATDLPMQGEFGGVQWIVLKEGTGASPKGPDSMVKVNYTGYLVNGVKFDSSVDRGKPLESRLDRLIKGWTQGVMAMKVGEKRKLIIPYNLAWGDTGRPPMIPPRAAVIFDVELLDTDMAPPAPRTTLPAVPPATAPATPAGGATPPKGGG
ncbi:MAG: FKBP-type peptidyl-prolyl cis-trans isomerase [Planctomycetes bacterium]|nr:FKBP-type peptidyl-prolyl cis-trans isomerase [Planctomycetota bacterium]